MKSAVSYNFDLVEQCNNTQRRFIKCISPMKDGICCYDRFEKIKWHIVFSYTIVGEGKWQVSCVDNIIIIYFIEIKCYGLALI